MAEGVSRCGCVVLPGGCRRLAGRVRSLGRHCRRPFHACPLGHARWPPGPSAGRTGDTSGSTAWRASRGGLLCVCLGPADSASSGSEMASACASCTIFWAAALSHHDRAHIGVVSPLKVWEGSERAAGHAEVVSSNRACQLHRLGGAVGGGSGLMVQASANCGAGRLRCRLLGAWQCVGRMQRVWASRSETVVHPFCPKKGCLATHWGMCLGTPSVVGRGGRLGSDAGCGRLRGDSAVLGGLHLDQVSKSRCPSAALCVTRGCCRTVPLGGDVRRRGAIRWVI